MTTQRLTPRTWYLVGAGLMVSAATMAIIAFGQMMSRVEGMHRVVMPGKSEVTLPAGRSTLYVENESIVGGKRISVTGLFDYRCGFEQKTVSMARATGQVEYSLGDYAGHNAFDVDVDAAGTYTLVCESDENQQFVLALGKGIGSAIVVLAIGLVPFLAGLALVIVVAVRRSSQKKRART